MRPEQRETLRLRVSKIVQPVHAGHQLTRYVGLNSVGVQRLL